MWTKIEKNLRSYNFKSPKLFYQKLYIMQEKYQAKPDTAQSNGFSCMGIDRNKNENMQYLTAESSFKASV